MDKIKKLLFVQILDHFTQEKLLILIKIKNKKFFKYIRNRIRREKLNEITQRYNKLRIQRLTENNAVKKIFTGLKLKTFLQKKKDNK